MVLAIPVAILVRLPNNLAIGDEDGARDALRQLAVVQFLSWFALFAMWIYTTPAVTRLRTSSSPSPPGKRTVCGASAQARTSSGQRA